MQHSLARLVIVGAFASFATACATAPMGGASTTASRAVPGASEWRSLIDPAVSAWRGYREQSVPAGWHVVDGVLTKNIGTNDLVSRDEYENFELTFDWKLHPGGNAGVFYRGTEEFEKIYFTAPEYQLLDDAGHPDGKSRLTAAGADYALYPAPAGVVHAGGEWNSSRILVRGNHVEHWLNGQQTVAYEFGSADWEARLKASKFAAATKYGRIRRGHLGIQGDHAGELSIREMRIRTLP